jgi:hypothetical protein
MLYSEIIAAYSQIHTKHINTLCGQKQNLWMLNRVVLEVTTGILMTSFHPVCLRSSSNI